jgi:predicted dehydrogenase
VDVLVYRHRQRLSKRSSQHLRVGVIGAGVVARQIHAPGYAAAPQAELAGVASATRASAERLAGEVGNIAVYDEVAALLADEAIDAVSICTPPATHRELVEAALAGGKHVLLEKPIAPTLDEVEAIRRLARESDRVVEVVRNERFMEFNERVRDAVREGAVGDPLAILQTTSIIGPDVWAPSATWVRDPATGGGALLDLGVHKTDLALWLSGRELVEESPMALRDSEAIEDRGLLSFALDGGIDCAVHASWVGPADQSSLVIAGTEGVLSGLWSTGQIECRGRTEATWTTVSPWTPGDRSGVAMIDAFVERCLAGSRPVEDDPAWDTGTRTVLLGYAAAADA